MAGFHAEIRLHFRKMVLSDHNHYERQAPLVPRDDVFLMILTAQLI